MGVGMQPSPRQTKGILPNSTLAVPPSAISLICAALMGKTHAAAPDPPPRKPPWLIQA